jgi:hypothetical protein
VPILLPGPFTEYFNELKKQIQILSQENSAFKNQDVELQSLKQEKQTMEQLLKAKEDTIMSLNRENQMLLTANQKSQQGANKMVDTLKNLLQAKNSEIELNNLKMENALDKEKGKNKKLIKEIKRLKQYQHQHDHQQAFNSRETRPSNYTTVPQSTTSNTGINEDDPSNDFNYDTECGTENSSSDNTSSEGGDNANDLNYDSDA